MSNFVLADLCNLSYFIDSMKMKQTMLTIALCIGFSSCLVTPTYADCAGIKTSIINCEGVKCEDNSTPVDGKCADGLTPSVEQSGIWKLLLLVINIMTAGVGVLAIGGVAYGSFKYTTSAGNSEKAKEARAIIFNVIYGLIAYALMFSFLNYIIPGGLFAQ